MEKRRMPLPTTCIHTPFAPHSMVQTTFSKVQEEQTSPCSSQHCTPLVNPALNLNQNTPSPRPCGCPPGWPPTQSQGRASSLSPVELLARMQLCGHFPDPAGVTMNPSFLLSYFPVFPLEDLSHMPTFSEASFAQEKINKQAGIEWPTLGQNQMAFPVF